MNISLSPELEQFIQQQIQSGKYSSPDEVFTEALDLLKQRNQEKVDITTQANTIVRSEKGMNHTRLINFLQEGNWKAANKANQYIFWMFANSFFEVTEEDVTNFPCKDLRTIDQLWVQYSNGHFGFSVQMKILQEIQDKEKSQYNNIDNIRDQFGNQVGWRVNNEWIHHSDLKFGNNLSS
ncbi:MAG: GUN4 domain-containing protein [Cyanobacteria bacterium P01_G01_bin.39]